MLNILKYKTELKEAINTENHRVNIDSAKKKAVMQGMNYDGFHQMVLGADLKGVNPRDILELKPKTAIVNNYAEEKLKAVDLFQKDFAIQSEEGKGTEGQEASRSAGTRP